jgi:hypothetical protein
MVRLVPEVPAGSLFELYQCNRPSRLAYLPSNDFLIRTYASYDLPDDSCIRDNRSPVLGSKPNHRYVAPCTTLHIPLNTAAFGSPRYFSSTDPFDAAALLQAAMCSMQPPLPLSFTTLLHYQC